MKPTQLSKRLDENRARLDDELGESPDLVFHPLNLGAGGRVRLLLVYINGLSDKALITEQILDPIRACAEHAGMTRTNVYRRVVQTLNATVKAEETGIFDGLLKEVLAGNAALLVDGYERALTIHSAAPPSRGITEPHAEILIRGSRDGFNEVLQTSEALIRHRVRHPDVRFEQITIGDVSRTPVDICYIKGIVHPDVLEEVRRLLGEIEIDSVLDTGYLEEYLTPAWYSPFPIVLSTERPDKVSAALLEGKVAIAAEGTPFVLIVPSTLWDFLISPSDYYQSPMLMTFIRWIRVFAFVIALTLPSFYVALTTFHQEMIPTTLALQIAAGREGTPFPAVVEALMLELQFEILREAGLRIPEKIGTAVSVVGVLVIGQALVAAGVVSPIIVIIVSSTAVASFAVPIYTISTPTRLLRFPLMLLAATLGVFGLAWGVGLIIIHLASLRSFGRPYLAPVTPLRASELQDSPLVRAPWWVMLKRPYTAQQERRRRQPPGQMPNRKGGRR